MQKPMKNTLHLPLMLAIQKGHLGIACSIIDQLDDEFIDELSFGKNPLHAIVKRSNHEDQNAIRLIQILCRTDIYIYQLDKNNFTPLALAVKLNKPNFVELLIDGDANPNDAYGNTPPPCTVTSCPALCGGMRNCFKHTQLG